MYEHILVAVDGSELAHKGLEHGLVLAKALDADITVLTVSEPMHPDSVRAARLAGLDNIVIDYNRQLESLAKERFEVVEGRARDHGIEVNVVHKIDESPAETIVRLAKARDCDLIVMSSHGRRGIQKILLGSQTSEVLVKASVPVLVIR
ncbi:universal stress protein [Sinisalibacter aestuarii]|uniref:Universal stress protein n=1 Tax=Sinisalibacter aestuarii TaxID=2949426 RepID=A0ABQ5LRI0_9RHOB|nr:universal stress protein [Sinisalibacter aestuarii]GKY86861.1 universal stress protein A [Sinisalibacter aestuarii]